MQRKSRRESPPMETLWTNVTPQSGRWLQDLYSPRILYLQVTLTLTRIIGSIDRDMEAEPCPKKENTPQKAKKRKDNGDETPHRSSPRENETPEQCSPPST